MAKSFKPEEYADEYQQALQKVIDAKLKGEKIATPKAPKVEVGDIMAALRASISAAKMEPAGAR
jgi:non-homologous end joining protein Ku